MMAMGPMASSQHMATILVLPVATCYRGVQASSKSETRPFALGT